MFTLNKKTDYGLLLVSELMDQKEYVSLSKLVEKTSLPLRFIARIASDLTKNGILQSHEGKIGGYKLIKNLKKISLLDFLKIFNKDLEIVKCQNNQFDCQYDKFCNHKLFLRKKLTEYILVNLKKWTLADLMDK